MGIDLLRETKLHWDTTALLQYSQFVRNVSIYIYIKYSSSLTQDYIFHRMILENVSRHL